MKILEDRYIYNNVEFSENIYLYNIKNLSALLYNTNISLKHIYFGDKVKVILDPRVIPLKRHFLSNNFNQK